MRKKQNQNINYSFQGIPKQINSPNFISTLLSYDLGNQNDFQFVLDNEPEIPEKKSKSSRRGAKAQDPSIQANPFSFNFQNNFYSDIKLPQIQDPGFWINPSSLSKPTRKRSSSRIEFPSFEQNQPIQKSNRSKPKPASEPSQNPKSQNFFEVGQNAIAIYLPDKTEEDKKFAELCNDSSVQINPYQIGFIPHNYFRNEFYTFGSIVGDYFQKKNNPNCRFLHKLYNAIKLGEAYPEYLNYVGVSWISKEVIQVSKYRFARLLGIKTVDGSLFHRQGNFPSFGFVELTGDEIVKEFGIQKLNYLDFDVEKLLKHEEGIFVRNGDIDKILEMCKWTSSKVRN